MRCPIVSNTVWVVFETSCDALQSGVLEKAQRMASHESPRAISFITSRFKAKKVHAGYLILGIGFCFTMFVCLVSMETEYINVVIPDVARIADHILAMAKTVVSAKTG
jgi:hypothetical protein